MDVKVFVTQPNAPVHVDMVLPGRAKTKLLRSTYPGGQALINNLVAFEEMKLDDVKLSELASLQARLGRELGVWLCCGLLLASAPRSQLTPPDRLPSSPFVSIPFVTCRSSSATACCSGRCPRPLSCRRMAGTARTPLQAPLSS